MRGPRCSSRAGPRWPVRRRAVGAEEAVAEEEDTEGMRRAIITVIYLVVLAGAGCTVGTTPPVRFDPNMTGGGGNDMGGGGTGGM